jgi:hypothetical protein
MWEGVHDMADVTGKLRRVRGSCSLCVIAWP